MELSDLGGLFPLWRSQWTLQNGTHGPSHSGTLRLREIRKRAKHGAQNLLICSVPSFLPPED